MGDEMFLSSLRDSWTSSEDSSDSSDDELIGMGMKYKNENFIEKTVGAYDEEDFFNHFRLSRSTAEAIGEKYKENDVYKKGNHGAYGKISAFHQVLIFLWFIGHQTASFRDVADRFNITLSSLHRIVRRMVYFFSSMSPEIIKWPNDEEKTRIAEGFASSGFPNVIGAIDGSHVRLDKPSVDPDSYLNRKGFYSIQMQVVCDDKKRIRDVFIGYPGSVHDSRIFRNSPLYQNLADKCASYLLLGDSGYPLMPQLMTPYKDFGNLSRLQRNFNKILNKNRYRIEHTFGMLKQKFRQLYHVKLRDITLICHLIKACCVLHNLALDDNFELNEEELAASNDIAADVENVNGLEPSVNNAKRMRDEIAGRLPLQ